MIDQHDSKVQPSSISNTRSFTYNHIQLSVHLVGFLLLILFLYFYNTLTDTFVAEMRKERVKPLQIAAVLHYNPQKFTILMDIGTMTFECTDCGAQKFKRETPGTVCAVQAAKYRPH